MTNKLWNISSIGIALFIAIPILVILTFLFGESSEIWHHLKQTVLKKYIGNSVKLMIGTGLLTIIIGVSTAWFVSVYEFKGRRFFEWALILPLAIPSYILAFTYSGIFDYTGIVQSFTRNVLHWQTDTLVPFNIMSLPGVVLVLSLALFPYVYLITRAFFLHQSQSLIEASLLLGNNHQKTFFHVALPIARPAIVAGVSLVLMEVLNDYGAVKYYGVSTFTTGIFRAWFAFNDLPSAVRLAAILVLLVIGLLGLERWQRKRMKYHNSSRNKPLSRVQLTGTTQILIIIACSIPFLLGFLIPVLQLLQWTIEAFPSNIDHDFPLILWNSTLSAFLAAIVAVFIALWLAYMMRWNKNAPFQKYVGRISTVGYAIPGAVIAIGVLIPMSWLDKNVFGSLLLTGSLTALTYAYIVRFLAVAFNSIDSGFEKINSNLNAAAALLGASRLRILFSVNLPLLKNSLLAAMILVFVDILKELPLTLILRPFNFDTLATKTFELASDEMLKEASVYALIIIIIGTLPILFLNRLIK